MNKHFSSIIILILLTSFVTSLSIDSLDRVDIISNHEDLNKEHWLIEATLDQFDDEIVGYIDKEIIEEGGATAEYDLRLSSEVTERSCDYNLQDTGQDINLVEVIDGVYSWWECGFKTWTQQQQMCWAVGGIWIDKELFDYCPRCIGISSNLGNYMNVLTPQSNFLAQFDITINGQTESGILNSQSNPEIPSNQLGNRAWVGWIGNLAGSSQCPIASDQDIKAVEKDNQRKLIYEPNYIIYKNYHSSGMVNCLEQRDADYCVNSYNLKANTALLTKTFNSGDGNTAFISGDKVRIILDKAVIFPKVKMRIDADWLGIFIGTGEPKILSASSECFAEGSDVGEIIVNIKNVGEEDAPFSLSANCDTPFMSLGNIPNVELDKDQEKTVELPIGVSTDITEDVTGSCIVTMRERNTGDEDTETVSVCAKASFFCNSGEERCNLNLIEVCSENVWELKEECPSGCELKDGEYVCIEGKDCDEDEDCDEGEVCKSGTCVKDVPPVILECSWYESKVETQELDYKLWNYIGIGKPKKIDVTKCVTSGWVYLASGVFVILILGTITILTLKPKKRGKKK